MNVFEKLTRFVQRVFKTNLEIFLEALKLSPNAQGYVSGSITELLLKKKLEEEYAIELCRIREKWEGKKHPNHHGDFYFRKPNSNYWYVLESKGIKSNSEKWHKLYNYENLKNFLINHHEKTRWINTCDEVEQQVVNWISDNLPRFNSDYSLLDLYEYEEVQKYQSKRETKKSIHVSKLKGCSRDEINCMIEERLSYLNSRIKVLETHFVSGTSASSQRTQATPRKDEFNIISSDIFLKHKEHKFVFANPKNLDSSGDDANHLQQNYIMGFVFVDEQGNSILKITDEWYEDFNEVYNTLGFADSIRFEDMQIDNRYTAGDK